MQYHERGTGNQTDGCWRKEQRRAGAGLVPQGADVGAVRVSAGGWEGWVLEGLQVRPSSQLAGALGFPACFHCAAWDLGATRVPATRQGGWGPEGLQAAAPRQP